MLASGISKEQLMDYCRRGGDEEELETINQFLCRYPSM